MTQELEVLGEASLECLTSIGACVMSGEVSFGGVPGSLPFILASVCTEGDSCYKPAVPGGQ